MINRLRDRPTSDLVVLAFAALIVLIVAAGSIALMVAELRGADINANLLAERLGKIVSSLVAVCVGYVAGRGVNDGGSDKGGQ